MPVDAANGLAVAICDNITTIPTSALGEHIGMLLDHQEQMLSAAVQAAFDLADVGFAPGAIRLPGGPPRHRPKVLRNGR